MFVLYIDITCLIFQLPFLLYILIYLSFSSSRLEAVERNLIRSQGNILSEETVRVLLEQVRQTLVDLRTGINPTSTGTKNEYFCAIYRIYVKYVAISTYVVNTCVYQGLKVSSLIINAVN